MRSCLVCDTELAEPARGRKPKFCSTRCRVASHRADAQIDAFIKHLAGERLNSQARAFEFVSVPLELREINRWIRHEAKRPMAVGGWWCSVTDPSHWGSFTDAYNSEYGDGLGFVLNGDGIVCLDLDDCVVDGVPSREAIELMDALPDTYIEFSPSGRGLHIWGRGFMSAGRRFTRGGLKIEAYPDGRYITVTGNVYRDHGLAVLDLSPLGV
jgi:primase-polymerase (primpol)-like protein